MLLFSAAGLVPAFAGPNLFVVRPAETLLRLTYAAPGETVEFIAPPVRDEPPAWPGDFQWFKDDAALPGETTATLTLAAVTEVEAGNYRLRYTSPDGAVEWSQTMPLNIFRAPASGVDTSFTADLPDEADLPAVLGLFPDGSYLVEARVPAETEHTTAEISGIIGRSWPSDWKVRLNYYRLREDGSRVADFAIPASAGPVLALLPDGSMLTRHAPFRFSSASEALSLPRPAGWPVPERLEDVALDSTGAVYYAQGNRIARLPAPYAVATGFYVDPDSERTVVALAVDAFDRLLGETRTPLVLSPGAPPFYTFQRTLRRWLPDGRLDATFKPGLGGLAPVFAESEVASLPSPWSGYVAVRRFTGARLEPRMSFYHGDGTPWSDLTPPALLGGSRQDAVAVSRPINRFMVLMRSRGDSWLAPTPGYDWVSLEEAGYERDPAQDSGTPDLAGEVGFRGWTEGDLVQPYQFATTGYMVGGRFEGWDGHRSPKLVRLYTGGFNRTRSPFAVIEARGDYQATWWNDATPGPAQPAPIYVPNGEENLTLTCVLHGFKDTYSYTLEWMALDGQSLPAARTGLQLKLGRPKASNLGRYQVRIQLGGMTVLSSVIELTTEGQDVSLSNLSARMPAGSGDATSIAGFVVAEPTTMLVRAVGPELQQWGVEEWLRTAGLRVFDAAGGQLSAPGLGQDAASAAMGVQVGAFPLDNVQGQSQGSTGLMATFEPGRYSVHLRGDAGPKGNIGLLELYGDNVAVTDGRLRNLSVRTTATSPAVPVSLGFVVHDPQRLDRRLQLLVRAVGPGLLAHGIEQVAADPVLTLYDLEGDVVAINDNWTSDPTRASSIRTAMNQVGAFALAEGSADAALLVDLPRGVYSAVVTDRGASTNGVVLVEVYVVPAD